MNLEFTVTNQIISRTDKNIIVAKSKNYVHCKFIFLTDDWGDEKKFAIFKDHKGRAYNVLLENDECTVPDDALKKDFFTVSVYSGDLITTNELVIIVIPSGYTKKICRASEGQKDVYVQAFEDINKKIDDIIYRDNILHIYKNNTLVRSINIFTDEVLDELGKLIEIPEQFSGSYNDLTDIPETFPVEQHTHI